MKEQWEIIEERNERFKRLWGPWIQLVFWTLVVGVVGLVMYVPIHFIVKYW